ncbi:MAG: phage integrase N-terminal SAM-like domain-containing protein [Pseudomonadota bacterium]
MSAKPRLLDQVRTAIRVRHYSYRTEQQYVGWIRRYIVFHHLRHPSEMGAPEIECFLSHLARDRNVSASTQSKALAALVFSIVTCSRWRCRGWRTLCEHGGHSICP